MTFTILAAYSASDVKYNFGNLGVIPLGHAPASNIMLSSTNGVTASTTLRDFDNLYFTHKIR